MKDDIKMKKKFTPDEISVFCEQISMLLNGGIPIYESTYILYSEMEDKRTKAVLKEIDDSVKENIPLFQALEKTEAFPDYMVYMVKIGETTGKLEEVMRSLASFYERESFVNSSIKSAVAYPIVLFGMMTAILLVLVCKILPMFEDMFNELSSDVTAATEDMMSFGMNAGRIIAIVACVVMAVIILLILWYKTSNGEKTIKSFFLNFVGTRKLSEKMAINKFISSLSLMITSGMNISEALDTASESTDNKDIQERIKKARELYNNKMPLDEALRETKLIVGMESRMVSVASKSGAIDVVFEKLSSQYNQSISESLSKISSVIETVLVVVLSILVGAVLLSVMLPLVSMISSIG